MEKFEKKLNLFKELLLFWRDISIKELENKPLSEREYEKIFCFGSVMQELVSDSYDRNNPWNYDADDMAVVADVHTDSHSVRCLEEGVGYPLEIFVIVNECGTVRLTRGAMFSYFEFTRSISQRLTDQEWRNMLTSKTPPNLPEWANSFMDLKQKQFKFDPWNPDNLYENNFTKVEINKKNFISTSTRLLQNYPNPFNPETVIIFELLHSSFVSLEIYNILGQKIRTLILKQINAGTHSIKWNGKDDLGRNVSSGIYLYKIKTEGFFQTKKMFLLR